APSGRPAPPAEGRLSASSPTIALRPAAWSMEDVLADLAWRSQTPLVADCYSRSWDQLASLPPLPLADLLEAIDRQYRVLSKQEDGIVLLRSRDADLQQAR